MRNCLIAFLMLMNGAVIAQSSGDRYVDAGELYDQDLYQAAVSEYLTVLNDGKASSELFFNIGNCYYSMDSVAHAILFYEKALKKDARNNDARHNLEMAKSKMDEPVIAVDEFFLLRWLRTSSSILSPMGWGIIIIVFTWVTALLYIRGVRRKHSFRLRERVIPIIVFVLFAVPAAFSYHQATRSDQAVLMTPVRILVAPDPISQPLRQLEPGEKLILLDQLEGYYKVRLVNFEVGWIPEESVSFI